MRQPRTHKGIPTGDSTRIFEEGIVDSINTSIKLGEKVPCSLEFFNDIQARFPERKPVPGATIEQIMYNAGQQEILRYIKSVAVLKTRSITGT